MPITQYEKERALKVIRNNKMLISLGIAGLTSLTRSEEHTLIFANCPAQHDDEIQICDEGQTDAMTNKWIRGKSMGMQLEGISQGLNTDSTGHR
ncbi:hypothetical protein Zm00014a_032139 [Zea mays]|uniref:Uncharacterized protein n=1 Tax=Zea mays TaxID=4577 RepID=A0A317Y7H1_MAIZE|nr:hypothetical protein Zm00014a_032139 [Zea mays]